MRKREHNEDIRLTRNEVFRIAGESGSDPRTVIKLLRGGDVNPPVAFAIRAAAIRLRITLPKEVT